MRWILALALVLSIAACKDDAKPAPKKKKVAPVSKSTPALKSTAKPAKQAMCCCASGGMNMYVETPSCARDLAGTCVDASKCK